MFYILHVQSMPVHRQCCPQGDTSQIQPPPPWAPSYVGLRDWGHGHPGTADPFTAARTSSREEGERSALHVALLVSSVSPRAEQRLGSAPQPPGCFVLLGQNHCQEGLT